MEPLEHAVPKRADPATETTMSGPAPTPARFRRTVLTAGMAAALLIAGGVAVVSAASPDSSATPSASQTTSSEGTAGDRGDCPLEDGGDDTTSTTPSS